MKRIIGAVVLIAVVFAGIVVIRQRKQSLDRAEQPAPPAIPVMVATVREGEVGGRIATVAVIRSATAATVSAQVAGALLEVRFREGDPVRRGEIMARIDPRVLDDAMIAAEARVAAAREEHSKQQAIFERDTVLFENRAIARQAFEVSKAMIEAARSSAVIAERALESARTLRSFADVTAPYFGIVTARLAEPGDLAGPGKPLYSIQVAGPVRLISKVAQASLARLAVGGEVTLENDRSRLTAKIARSYPAMDAMHLGTVEIDLPEAPFRLTPGATVSATYAASPVRGLTLPVAALLQGIDETLVIRVRDGKTDPVPVLVEADDGVEAVVTGGVRAGDTVVTGLPSELMALAAGAPVTPQGR